jgi:DNA-binding transcriptional regulator YdaS (Cro superfamily)
MHKREESANLNEGLRAAIDACGSRYALAKRLGLTPVAVLDWWRIPADLVVEVERVSGVPRERLRPELYY